MRIRKLRPDAILPARKTPGAVGYDLHAVESYVIPSRKWFQCWTGIAVEIPPGCAGYVCSRSGLALGLGVVVLNAPGTVDLDYRGEVGVLLMNHGERAHQVHAGDRIAQLVIVRVDTPEIIEVDELGATVRGSGGFGSTGSR